MKRGYGLRRSRLKDHHGMQTWTGWSILTYNLDTLAIRATETLSKLNQEQNHLPGTAAIDNDAAVLVHGLSRLSGAVVS